MTELNSPLPPSSTSREVKILLVTYAVRDRQSRFAICLTFVGLKGQEPATCATLDGRDNDTS